MNRIHLIYMILTPLVIWLFVLQLENMKKLPMNEINFFIGVILLSTLFCMALICKVVYPDDVGYYTLNNEIYNERIKNSRDLFFGLLGFFLILWSIFYIHMLGFRLSDSVRIAAALLAFGMSYFFNKKENAEKLIIDSINKDKSYSYDRIYYVAVTILSLIFLVFVLISSGKIEDYHLFSNLKLIV